MLLFEKCEPDCECRFLKPVSDWLNRKPNKKFGPGLTCHCWTFGASLIPYIPLLKENPVSKIFINFVYTSATETDYYIAS